MRRLVADTMARRSLTIPATSVLTEEFPANADWLKPGNSELGNLWTLEALPLCDVFNLWN